LTFRQSSERKKGKQLARQTCGEGEDGISHIPDNCGAFGEIVRELPSPAAIWSSSGIGVVTKQR
jgi:hypothetical protein